MYTSGKAVRIIFITFSCVIGLWYVIHAIVPSPPPMEIGDLRYCLSQQIRIDGARRAVNRRSQADIDRINTVIDHFNYFCAKDRYKKGFIEAIRAEVEARREELVQEGYNQFLQGQIVGAKP